MTTRPPKAEAPMLELSGIGKSFGSLQALSDVSLDVSAGEIHCLLGENGAGKSTLCNIIFGFLTPDTGEMRLAGQDFRPRSPAECLAAGIAMVHQHFSVIDSMTVVDNLMLGRAHGRLDRRDFSKRIRDVSTIYGLDVDPWRLVGDMSIGEKQRLEFVKCLLGKPRLLVLDEPTAVLPPKEIDTLLEICKRIAASGCSIILVTHKLAEIGSVADRTTVLRGGRAVASAPRAEMDIDQLVRAMVGRSIDTLDRALADAGTVETPGGARAAARVDRLPQVLQVKAVNYRDAKGVGRLNDVNLTVAAGEIVGIAGVEGNGQSELADVLAGIARPQSGHIELGGRDVTGLPPKALASAGVGVVPEDRHGAGCILSMSVAENLFLDRLGSFSTMGFLRRRVLNAAARTAMQEHDIRAPGPEMPMRSLSGGNQQKVVLARELSRRPLNFLLAAQPTRGLDIGAVEAVYRRIRVARAAGVGVLLVSSELNELMAVADRILVMYRGAIVGECRGGAFDRETIGGLMAGQPMAVAS